MSLNTTQINLGFMVARLVLLPAVERFSSLGNVPDYVIKTTGRGNEKDAADKKYEVGVTLFPVVDFETYTDTMLKYLEYSFMYHIADKNLWEGTGVEMVTMAQNSLAFKDIMWISKAIAGRPKPMLSFVERDGVDIPTLILPVGRGVVAHVRPRDIKPTERSGAQTLAEKITGEKPARTIVGEIQIFNSTHVVQFCRSYTNDLFCNRADTAALKQAFETAYEQCANVVSVLGGYKDMTFDPVPGE